MKCMAPENMCLEKKPFKNKNAKIATTLDLLVQQFLNLLQNSNRYT